MAIGNLCVSNYHRRELVYGAADHNFMGANLDEATYAVDIGIGVWGSTA